ncbi:MAG: fructose-bisphosphate aldolase [Sphaerochaetaceae bacterium]|jgi:class I fructose-bisphosphate aldolase|nr:fructose-bisphosphate aldolase [Sphaerochaetaceae bacterium]
MIRLRRLFRKNGKTVIIALDHGLGMHVNPELDDTGRLLEQVIEGGADGVLVSYGTARKYQSILSDVAVIMRADGGGSQIGPSGNGPQLLYTIEDALRIGADAVVCMGFPGTPYEHQTMEVLAALVREGHAWGMPVVAEMLPGGFTSDPPKTVENIRLASRTGCEYGADVIKTTYVGPPEEFRKVIEASYQPVIVLGGEKTSDLNGMFLSIEQAISVGAAGVAIGRNVWRHRDPVSITRALVDIVHNGKRVSELELREIAEKQNGGRNP